MKYSLLLFYLILFSYPISAQNKQTRQEILKPIYQLFEGMLKNDSSLVRKVFAENISFSTVSKNGNDETYLKAGDVQGFLNNVGSPKEVVLKEVISNINVQVDGDFASVWCDYTFYLSDEFHHCGIDQFLLIKTESGWKIRQVVDTRRITDCND